MNVSPSENIQINRINLLGFILFHFYKMILFSTICVCAVSSATKKEEGAM